MILSKLRRRLKVALRNAVMDAGFELYKRSPDRTLLQRRIFPFFSKSDDFRKVLFVGCDWYTRGYRRVFARHDYWTLDVDPDKRRFGAAQHIVDSATRLGNYFVGDVDVIFCNGVFGHGINTPEEARSAFQGCYDSLRRGGILVIGWNDTPESRPFDPLDSSGLREFKPFVFPPLAVSRFRVPMMRTRHVYDFLVK